MRIDAKPQNPQAFVEIVLPHRCVPFGRAALEHFSPPDVVHQDIDVAVSIADPIRQVFHLAGVEMIDRDGDAVSTKPRDQFGSLLDSFGPVVVRSRRAKRSCAPAGADDRRAGFPECQSNPAPGAPRRPGDNGDAAAERLRIRRPGHGIALTD